MQLRCESESSRWWQQSQYTEPQNGYREQTWKKVPEPNQTPCLAYLLTHLPHLERMNPLGTTSQYKSPMSLKLFCQGTLSQEQHSNKGLHWHWPLASTHAYMYVQVHALNTGTQTQSKLGSELNKLESNGILQHPVLTCHPTCTRGHTHMKM